MPEKVNLDHSPAFTFGQRITEKTINDTPGKDADNMCCKYKNFRISVKSFLAPCAYMPENVVLDHVPSYVFHKSFIQTRGYIKCVYFVYTIRLFV